MCVIRLLFVLCLFAWPKPDVRNYERSPDMATNIWQGTDGVWDTAGNWSNGAKPAAGDFVILDGSISQGSVTSGQDNESAVSLAGLWSLGNYRGSVGTSATLLDIGFQANTEMVWRGSGALHLSGDANGRYICDSPNAVDAVSLYGVEDEIIVKRGRLIVTATHGANITALSLVGGICELLENGAFDVAGARMTGGEVLNSRPMDAAGAPFWLVNGGHWHQKLNGATGITLNMSGGLLTWDTTTALNEVLQFGGFMDFTNTGQAKTLSKLTIYGGDYEIGTQTTLAGLHDFRPDFPDIP